LFSINYRDPRPIYEQIKEQFKQLILSGALAPDARLPSVRELAFHLAINPNTIQRAYRELEAEGYIYSVRAKGSFVAEVNKSTVKKHCTELFDALGRTVSELYYAGVSKDEITLCIDEIYNKGGNQN